MQGIALISRCRSCSVGVKMCRVDQIERGMARDQAREVALSFYLAFFFVASQRCATHPAAGVVVEIRKVALEDDRKQRRRQERERSKALQQIRRELLDQSPDSGSAGDKNS